jgi:hypothetical protein
MGFRLGTYADPRLRATAKGRYHRCEMHSSAATCVGGVIAAPAEVQPSAETARVAGAGVTGPPIPAGLLCGLEDRAHCRGMMHDSEPIRVSSASDAPADQLRLAGNAWPGGYGG